MQELQPKQHWFKVIDADENPDLTECAQTHSLRKHKLRDRYNSSDCQTGRTQTQGPHAWYRAARAKRMICTYILRGCQKMGSNCCQSGHQQSDILLAGHTLPTTQDLDSCLRHPCSTSWSSCTNAEAMSIKVWPSSWLLLKRAQTVCETQNSDYAKVGHPPKQAEDLGSHRRQKHQMAVIAYIMLIY